MGFWLRELRFWLSDWIRPALWAFGIVAVIQVIWHVAAWVVG